jgi:hypothetical protein
MYIDAETAGKFAENLNHVFKKNVLQKQDHLELMSLLIFCLSAIANNKKEIYSKIIPESRNKSTFKELGFSDEVKYDSQYLLKSLIFHEKMKEIKQATCSLVEFPKRINALEEKINSAEKAAAGFFSPNKFSKEECTAGFVSRCCMEMDEEAVALS